MPATPLRRLELVLTFALGTVLAAYPAHSAGAERARPNALVLKLRADGAHAVTACAERTFERSLPFQGVTSDRSDSLDRAIRVIGVRGIRALFRQSDGRSFHDQRRRLRTRLSRKARDLPAPPDLAHVYRVELAEDANSDEALELLARDPHVAWVQRDHQNAVDEVANDPFLNSSGSWGQAYEDLWGLWQIRAPSAWMTTRGAGVIVAVVDTGLDYHHPDIEANVWVNPGEDLDGNGRVDPGDWNGIDDDENGFVDDLRGFDFASSVDADQDGRFDGPSDLSDPDPFDDRGHGTHVAGTIAAVANNGIGIAGVAPEARIMAVKGFAATGPGLDSNLWRGVLYAAENGATVINNSWSCSPECPENPLAEEIVALVHAMDVVVVTSAGNRRKDVVFNSPEQLRETITVASFGQDGAPSASFTNRGWLVDVAAPGGGPSDDRSVQFGRRNILSLRSSADLSAEFATVAPGYWRTSGTSMAAPHVAGTVALLRSVQPGLGYEDIRRILRLSAEDRGPPGHDPQMGAGALDALAAVTHPPLPDLRAALTAPRQGSVHRPGAGRAIEIEGTAAGSDLLRFELSYGLGNEPEQWAPLAAATLGPIEAGVLVRWPLDHVEEGTYTLRLVVEGRSGARYEEFLILSIEANHFVRVSEPGAPVGSPAISGGVVVWESRREADDPFASSDDFNLFASRFEGSSHVLLSDAAGDQKNASIAGRTVSWMDSRNGRPLPEIFGCVLRRGGCKSFDVSRGEMARQGPASTPGAIFWTDSSSGLNDVRGCRTRGSSCEPAETGLASRPRTFLRSDGQSLVWSEAAGRVGICRVGRADEPDWAPGAGPGLCDAAGPAQPIWPLSRATASGSLLAWVDARSDRPLQICKIDPQTNTCDPVEAARDVTDPEPSLSGRRLVWEASLGSEARDVFYCEFDPLRSRCPAQRITAHHASQTGAAIDGRQVVWEDPRNGPVEIHGIVLPELAQLPDPRIREGRRLRFAVRQRSSSRDESPLVLAAESVAHESLEALGASFRQLGGRPSIGIFDWRPRRGQAGRYLFTFSGTTKSGLATHRTIEIEVLERLRVHHRRHRP